MTPTQRLPDDGDQPPIPPRLDLHLRYEGEPRRISMTVDGVPIEIAATPAGIAAAALPASTPVTAPSGSTPPPGLSARWREFRQDPAALREFLRLTSGALFTILVALAIQAGLYHLLFSKQQGFLGRFGWWLLYLDINVVALATMLVYFRAYHLSSVPHMLGMMMGMTVGMQVGAMLGSVLGPTNGFFVGAMVGMLGGALAGIYIGCRCGTTMAVIQGLMSGVMSGTMGAMLTVMMLRDRVLTFMPVFTVANLLIVMGCVYLFHDEAVAPGHCGRRGEGGFLRQAGLSLFAIAALSLLMLYGPRGPMVWTGSAPTAGMHAMPPAAPMPPVPGMPGMPGM